jgi:hypothetical protein
MKYIIRYITKYLAPFCLILMLSILAVAQANAGFPLVIVVHGIGKGNQDDGWSRKYAEAWGVETHEVTYRYEGRTVGASQVDFAPRTADWVLSAQKQIKDIVSKNPGRRVIIVSHSWGAVISKLALAGGTANGVYIDEINLGGVEIEELVTLAAPLGSPEIMALARAVPDNLPKFVKHWTNFSDIDDPVSSESHNLKGADNVEVKGSGWSADPSGITAHKGIWINPMVRKHIWNEALRVSNMPRLPATRVGIVTGPVEQKPTGTVRFTAWDNTNGKALAGAQVIIYGAINSPSEKFREMGNTNDSGTVDISGVSLGAYTVKASHASCQPFESGITNLKPNETHRIIMDCTINAPTGRRETRPGPASGGNSEEQLVAEYRSLLPLALEKNKKPWHTRINIIANAVKQGSGYHVNYQAFCLIEQGPDKNKDYMCSEFETVLDLGGIKSAVADMRRQLGP